jgi:two-component system chemotaxis sensor kinase CheA
MLELENYRVSAAVDGIDGLEKLKEKTFDLIISDLDMPRMDGFTFIENLRRNQDYQRIPIIVISSLKDQGTRQRTLDLGADAYIVKSDFEQSNLIHSVHQFIPDEIV